MGDFEVAIREYVRKGVASIFMEVEPLGGKRKVKITERRTRIDWAHFIKEMFEERYTDAEKVVLVMDNLNTHNTRPRYTRPSRLKKPGVWRSALKYIIPLSTEVGWT